MTNEEEREAAADYLVNKITGTIALQAEIDRLKAGIGQLKKHNDIAAEVIPALMEANRELLAACKALFDLVEDGELVRNIDHDADFARFTKQSVRIVKALILCKDAIARATT